MTSHSDSADSMPTIWMLTKRPTIGWAHWKSRAVPSSRLFGYQAHSRLPCKIDELPTLISISCKLSCGLQQARPSILIDLISYTCNKSICHQGDCSNLVSVQCLESCCVISLPSLAFLESPPRTVDDWFVGLPRAIFVTQFGGEADHRPDGRQVTCSEPSSS